MTGKLPMLPGCISTNPALTSTPKIGSSSGNASIAWTAYCPILSDRNLSRQLAIESPFGQEPQQQLPLVQSGRSQLGLILRVQADQRSLASGALGFLEAGADAEPQVAQQILLAQGRMEPGRRPVGYEFLELVGHHSPRGLPDERPVPSPPQ